MTRVLINHFDRGKPFYPLVMHYLAQLIGFKELGLRGITGQQSLDDLAGRLPALAAPGADEAKAVEVREGLRKLSGPLELRSEFQGGHITVDVDEIARDIVANSAYIAASTMLAAGSLLVLAHELSKGKPWYDTGPLWEFLRHCRNAVAHGGTFTFRGAEPSRPAAWGIFNVTRQLQGTKLFKDAAGQGMLSPGDPIRLLWDIEQAYPQMTA